MGDEAQVAPSLKPTAGLQGFLEELGPGLIMGAADDDPSGISTYSVAGASFGYATLWTALLSFPLMAAVQLMCARLGMVQARTTLLKLSRPPRAKAKKWSTLACGSSECTRKEIRRRQ
jgi:Mn2+/Fe2+ NRAMP family transporter